MKLYYGPGTCAVGVWIALEWAGADYEVERVVTGSEEYRKINPVGAVPALDLGDGKIRTQASSLLKYIANKFPENNLGPDAGPERTQEFDEIADFLSADFHPSFKGFFGASAFTLDGNEDDVQKVKEASFKQIDEAMQLLDRRLDGKDYLYGNRPTVLDPLAFVMSRWAQYTPKSWDQYPNVKRFSENMLKDPAVVAIMEKSVAK